MKMSQNQAQSIQMIYSLLKILIKYLVIKPYQVLTEVFPESKI